jgi:hypothetical protein
LAQNLSDAARLKDARSTPPAISSAYKMLIKSAVLVLFALSLYRPLRDGLLASALCSLDRALRFQEDAIRSRINYEKPRFSG